MKGLNKVEVMIKKSINMIYLKSYQEYAVAFPLTTTIIKAR